MKYALLLLLCLTGLFPSVASATPAPPVPATLEVAGLHLVLSDEARHLIQQRADGLMRHQPSFKSRVELADASFPIIDKILQQEGVPLDFRYLALQESALLGDAESNHGAVGYWQLKRETATGLGLRVDEIVDERRHLAASTRAAARYLLRSQASTQNWLTTLLSYQTGLGGVKPYQLATDADATEMNIEADTHPYILMFLAQKLVFEPACGLNPAPPLLLQEFPAVSGQTLAQQAAGLSTAPADLTRHNRWLLHPEDPVPAEGGPYTLLVPVSSVSQRVALISRQAAGSGAQLITPPPMVAHNAAQVQVNHLKALIALPNESAEDLARRGGVRLSQFLRDNDLRAFDKVVAGRPYFLEKKREDADTDYHVIQPGEDLADVSQKYGIQRHAIRRKNHLAANEELRAGRVLWLRHIRPREVAVEYRDPNEAAAMERRPGASHSAPAPTAPMAAAPRRAQPLPLPAPVASVPDSTPAPTDEASADVPTPAAKPVHAAELPPPAPLPAPAPVADEPRPRRATEAPVSPSSAPEPAPVSAPARTAAAGRQIITVTTTAPPTSEPALPAPVAAASPSMAPLTADGLYQVQARETVYSLARRYHLRPADLLAWNNLPANASLRLGQQLRLSAPAITTAEVTTSVTIATPVGADVALPATHTVAAGETLYSIARRYKRTVPELQQLNGKASAAVRVGEVLRIAAP
jgi:membrane-bound lytic murein transglycosylase D